MKKNDENEKNDEKIEISCESKSEPEIDELVTIV